jgi:hypothetical protein
VSDPHSEEPGISRTIALPRRASCEWLGDVWIAYKVIGDGTVALLFGQRV